MNRGIWYAVGAYTAWGLMPAYWKLLHRVPAVQMISHRVVWSWLLLSVFVVLSRNSSALRAASSDLKVLRTYSVAAVLIAVNWLVFIWAVNAGFIVETSLGYFINPLISVLLGVVVLGERLRPLQLIPIALASTGVLYVSIAHGSVPWIALLLATTFALYGLVKKTAPLGSVYGLTLETGLLLVPAVLYLLYRERAGDGAFLHEGAGFDALLVGAGAITTGPLLMFASAARRIPLLWIGILQYIAPTLSLLLGVLVYGEPFSHDRLIGFGLVWTALALFAIEGVAAHRATFVAAPPE